jgi:hypothetical protein
MDFLLLRAYASAGMCLTELLPNNGSVRHNIIVMRSTNMDTY